MSYQNAADIQGGKDTSQNVEVRIYFGISHWISNSFKYYKIPA